MDRRAYLISVFDDTLERINGDFDLHKAQQQSIAAQKLILEKEALEIPAPRFGEKIANSSKRWTRSNGTIVASRLMYLNVNS